MKALQVFGAIIPHSFPVPFPFHTKILTSRDMYVSNAYQINSGSCGWGCWADDACKSSIKYFGCFYFSRSLPYALGRSVMFAPDREGWHTPFEPRTRVHAALWCGGIFDYKDLVKESPGPWLVINCQAKQQLVLTFQNIEACMGRNVCCCLFCVLSLPLGIWDDFSRCFWHWGTTHGQCRMPEMRGWRCSSPTPTMCIGGSSRRLCPRWGWLEKGCQRDRTSDHFRIIIQFDLID